MIEMLIRFPSDIVSKKKNKKKQPNEKQFFFPRVFGNASCTFWKPPAAPRCSRHLLLPGEDVLFTSCPRAVGCTWWRCASWLNQPVQGQFVTSDFRSLPCQGRSDTVAEQDTGQVVVVGFFFVLLSLLLSFLDVISKMSLIGWKRPSARWMRHLNSTGYLRLVSVSASERLRDICGDKLMM